MLTLLGILSVLGKVSLAWFALVGWRLLPALRAGRA